MPAIDANRNASRKAVRKVRAKRPPKVKVRPPSRTQVRQAQAQQRAYVSQGKAVKKAAKSQQVVSRAKAQERAYVSQGKAVAKAAPQQAKANRLAYLRRTRKTGLALIEDVAGKAVRGAVIPSTGGGPNLGGRGNLPFTHAKSSGRIATALAPKPVVVGKGTAGKLAGNLAKDLITFPAQAISSTYDVGAGVVEAAHGKPQRLKRIVKSAEQTDPVYNAAAAGVAAVKGDTKSAHKHLKAAEKAVVEHPGLTALEVTGVKGGVGRGLGRVGRSGLAGKAAKRAASTKRAPRVVPDTNLTQRRVYSRDVLTKAAQVTKEKAQRHHSARLQHKARSAPPERALELRQKAARVNPDRLPAKEIKRRVDERVAVNEDIRRLHRGQTVSQVRKVLKPVRHGKGAVPVVAQRITKASKADLRVYIAELKAEFPNLSTAQKHQNKTLRRQLQKVVDDPHVDMAAVERVARDYQKLTQPIQRKLVKRGLLAAEQADRAKLIPYAVRNMGARHDKTLGIVDKNGVPLPTEKIVEHMKANGVKPAAFITQAPNQRGARNFNVRSERAQAIPSKRRTGAATPKGTFDAHPATLEEGAARAQGLVDATDGFRRTIKEFGHRTAGKLTKFTSYDKARQAARDLLHDANGDPLPGAHAMRPVRLNPLGASKEQLDSLLNEVDSLDQGHAEQLTSAMRDALEGKPGPGKWGLIPDVAAQQLLEQLNSQGGGGGIKTVQLGNQAFRQTVLATSTTWLAGNTVEGLGRAALARAGVRSHMTGRRVLKRMQEISPREAEEAAHRIAGGGHFSSAVRLHIRRGAEQFDGTALAPVANALGKFWRLPGPKQAANLWHVWTDVVFNQVNGRFERNIQTAMLGKALRQSELMDGHLRKLSKAAVDDAANGLLKTENQVAFGRAVDDMYGRYSKFSPGQRKAFATYTPFAAWFLNSVYFVYRTLPRDHPVTTALITAAEQATEEWRKDHGLDQFTQGALPGFLQGSIPMKGGGHLRVSRYTPFGAFSDLPGTIKGQVLPLWNGVSAALGGETWDGKKLRVGNRDANDLEKMSFAALAFLEATVPVYSTGKRIVQQGPNAINPVKITKPKKATTGGSVKNPYSSGSTKNPYAAPGASNPYAAP